MRLKEELVVEDVNIDSTEGTTFFVLLRTNKHRQAMHYDRINKEIILDFIQAPHSAFASVCARLCIAAKLYFHSHPRSSSCAFQGLKRGFGRVQAVSVCF